MLSPQGSLASFFSTFLVGCPAQEKQPFELPRWSLRCFCSDPSHEGAMYWDCWKSSAEKIGMVVFFLASAKRCSLNPLNWTRKQRRKRLNDLVNRQNQAIALGDEATGMVRYYYVILCSLATIKWLTRELTRSALMFICSADEYRHTDECQVQLWKIS